jgi:DNA primase large subunit
MLSASSRIEAKKRAILDPKKQQFVKPQWEKQDYQHRMNFYTIPPTEDIALEDFEEWGIARLKVLAELEACHFRNRSAAETEEYMRPVLEKWLRLESNQSRSQDVQMQRKKDHYSHWTLRLAFASTADLRQRFTRLETQLFKLRLQADNSRERRDFIDSLPMSWEMLDAGEKNTWLSELRVATSIGKDDEENWFKVDWEKVPELVERRQVLLKKGKAYVHVREQTTMVLSEFTRSLETGLELAARFLPRMDEDNRLAPILHHLSQSFVAPDASYNENSGVSDIANINAGSIDGLSSHFPLCMQNLHRELRKNSHLKHQSRLQYTLFLKGIGLNMQECIVFWRKSFKLITDGKSPKIQRYRYNTTGTYWQTRSTEKFKSEYLYNVRHSYGDVGGDANKRGRGYSPFSCQKLLTEPLPSAGLNHGCPYRTYSPDNLIALLTNVGVSDRELLRNVREDVGRQRYHIACNRVFETTHKNELKKVRILH